MWSKQVDRLGKVADELLVSVAWAQWGRLSSLVSAGKKEAASIIDPEALLVMSMVGSRNERRLLDVTAGWLAEGYRLISTQRIRTVAAGLAPGHSNAVSAVAALALKAGDHRWKALAASDADDIVGSARSKNLGPLRLDSPQALMLRLRAGFGMGTKADALTLLIGIGEPLTLRAISDGTAYGSRPLRLALEDMVLAGLVERLASTPVEYRVLDGQWRTLLNGGYHAVPARADFPPPWQPWGDILRFCSQVIGWSTDITSNDSGTAYVATSRSRDVVEEYLTPAMGRQFSLSGPRSSQRWSLDAFEEVLGRLDDRVRKAV